MGLLDSIENKTVRRSEYGRMLASGSSAGRVVYASGIELIDYRKSEDCPFGLWFSIIIHKIMIPEFHYDELTDSILMIRNIKSVSQIFVVPEYSGGIYSFVSFGITYGICTLRDSIKLMWEVASTMWNFFGTIHRDIIITWTNDSGKSLDVRIEFGKCLYTFKNFDAYKHHNCLRNEEKDNSIIWHLVRRPISQEEAEKSNKWCRKYYENIVEPYLKKK